MNSKLSERELLELEVELLEIEYEEDRRGFFNEFFPDSKTPDVDVTNDNINDIYKHILKSKARVIINYGGRDSGKSFFSGGQYVPLCMATEDYFRGVAIRKTYVSNKDSTFTEIKDGIDVLGLGKTLKSIKSPLEIKNVNNGNKLIFRGMDDLGNLKSLKGINFWWFEEAEDLKESQYDDLLILLRGNGYQRALLTFNPVDEDHFTNNRFVKCKKDRILERFDDGEAKVWEIDIKEEIDGEMVEYTVLVLRSTFDDNKFIPPVRKLVIEKLKERDPVLYNVYRKGLYGSKAGRILSNWEELDFNRFGYEFNNFDKKGYAQDFGFNHYNCILSVAEKDNNLYVFDEIYVNEMSPQEIIDIAKRKRIQYNLRMFCDSAEPGTIRTWKKEGFRAVPVKKYQGYVKAQIDKLKDYNKIYINSRCINTLSEIKKWKWKEDKNGKKTDEPVAIEDDAMAALRYSTDLFPKRSKNYGKSKVVKGRR